MGDAEARGFLRRAAVHLGLAEIATVHRVGGVAGVVHLRRLDQQVAGAELNGQGVGGGALLRRKAGGDRGQRDRPAAKHVHRLGQQVAGVDAAGEADGHVLQVAQQIPQPRAPVLHCVLRPSHGK